MKKTALLLAILVILLTPLSVNAVMPRIADIQPSISFNGTTANCSVITFADSSDDEIQMTIKLWQGSKCIATWNEEGTGYVLFSDTVTVTILMCAAVLISVLFPYVAFSEEIDGSVVSNIEANNKISIELMSKFDSVDDSTNVKVNLLLTPIDSEAVMQLFAKRYPEEYEMYMKAENSDLISNELPVVESDVALKDGPETIDAADDIDADLLQSAIEAKRAVYKELCLKFNTTFLNKYVSAEQQHFVSAYGPLAVVEVTKSAALELASSENVSAINLFVDMEPESEDLDLANQITRADYVRDTYGNAGSGVKIGQIELQVPDTSDADLDAANIIIRPGDTVTHQHATTVAKILVGTDDSGSCDGLAPQATLYSCSFTNTNSLYEGIEWLLNQGVNVINMSSGNNFGGAYTDTEKWVDHIAVEHDVHFVKSAGNTAGAITCPGMAYNAITVGGLDDHVDDDVNKFTLFEYTSYQESGSVRAEKPNLVAPAVNFWRVTKFDHGTSYATAQVTGTIAQLCSYKPALKVKQATVAAMLMASAAEKVEATGAGEKGDTFLSSVRINEQISEKEGAGILDSRWARGIAYYGNYWSYTIDSEEFPYEKSITINASSNSLTRIAIFWLKRNTVNHTTNVVAEEVIADLNLFVYAPDGTLIDYSNVTRSNFEIVQFEPTVSGTYTIRITATNSEEKEHVGIAVW